MLMIRGRMKSFGNMTFGKRDRHPTRVGTSAISLDAVGYFGRFGNRQTETDAIGYFGRFGNRQTETDAVGYMKQFGNQQQKRMRSAILKRFGNRLSEEGIRQTENGRRTSRLRRNHDGGLQHGLQRDLEQKLSYF